jgi:hypothetical protein
MIIEQSIRNILKIRGVHSYQEYETSMSRIELEGELMHQGFSMDDIDQAITKLCNNGSMAMDEVSVYLYENPDT